MSKYKEVIEDMLESNKELFDSFKIVHDKFAKDQKKFREEFNNEGQDIMRVIQKWENILCGKTEGGKYGKFSTQLSEKFWSELKSHFPLIDKIGEIE